MGKNRILFISIIFILIVAPVVSAAPETRTYPEYDKLLNDHGEMRIAVLFGTANRGCAPDKDGLSRSQDWGAREYLALTQNLLSLGYERRPPEKYSQQPYCPALVEEFSKQTLAGRVVVRTFLGNTSFADPASRAFHYFYKDALENDSVIVYSGHAGIGGNLDLDKIEKARRFQIALPSDRYQIIVLDGCRTLHDSVAAYSKRKSGQNVDLLANDFVSLFDRFGRKSSALITALNRWAETGFPSSFQDISAQMDEDERMAVVRTAVSSR